MTEEMLTPGMLPVSVYRKYETEYHKIILMPPNQESTTAAATQLIEKLDRLWDFFRRGGFFSKNEAIEEYSTSRLKFFLIPFYIGRLHTIFQGDSRPSHLESATAYLTAFSDEMVKLQIAQQEQPEPTNPQERRKFAIAEFKERKDLEQKLQRMNDLTKEEDNRGSIGDPVDEETERELVVDILRLSTSDARNAARSCREEMPYALMRSQGVKPQEPKGPVPKMWVKRIDREEMRKQVFAPLESILPRPIPPEDETVAQPGKPKARLDASDEEEREEARREQSKWDDWKDDHPPFSQM